MPEMLENNFLAVTFRSGCAIIILVAYVSYIVAAQLSAQAPDYFPPLETLTTWPHALLGARFSIRLYRAWRPECRHEKRDIRQFVILMCAIGLILFFLPFHAARQAARLRDTPPVLLNQKFPPQKLVYYLLILGRFCCRGQCCTGGF